MKQFIIVSLIALVSISGTVFAQEGLTQTYTSGDGYLTIDYSSGWKYENQDGVIVFFNGDSEVLEMDVLPADTAFLALLPPEFLTMIGLEGQAPPDEIASMLSMLVAAEDDMEIGDPVTTTVGGREMVQTPITGALGDGFIGAIGFEAGTIGVWTIAAADEWMANEILIMEMLNTLRYAAPDVGEVPVFERTMFLELDSPDDWASSYALAFSPDERYLATTSYENDGFKAIGEFIQVWDFQTGEQVQKITFAEDAGMDDSVLLFAPSGEIIAYTDAGLEFYDVLTGEQTRTMDLFGEPIGATIGDGSQLLSYSAAGNTVTVAQVDITTGEASDLVSGVFREFGFSPDGTQMALLSLNDDSVNVQLFNLTTGELSEPFYEFVADYASAAVSNDGRMVALSMDYGHDIVVVDVATGEELFTFNQPIDQSFDQILFAPDGSYLFITQRERVLVIDVALGIQVATFESGIDGSIETLLMDSTGSYLVATAYGTTPVWKISMQ